ncbi:hypothetical protein GF342_01235 [Candidatus Woesearchaeota archaeon]|nr:hypothetical protein [Candidatus Woesearchaeota archaeon]
MRKKKPDNLKAKSMVAAAERDMTFTLTLLVSSLSGSTIIRNIYESFRILGDAILVSKGIELQKDIHKGHLNELFKLQIKTSRPLQVLDTLRVLRHSISYRGYSPSDAEIMDAIDIARKLFKPILSEVKKIIA